MKKGFITIYVLVVLLILSITATFIFTQNQNNAEINRDLYDKKQSLYLAESITNIYIEEELNNYIFKELSEAKTGEYKNSYFDDYIFKENNTNYKFVFSKDKYLKRDLEEKYRMKLNEVIVGNSVSNAEIYFDLIKNPIIFNREILDYNSYKDSFEAVKFIYEPKIINEISFDSTDPIIQTRSNIVIDKNGPTRFGGILIVDGDLEIKTDFTINGFLIVKGNIKIEDTNTLTINGGLLVGGGDKRQINYTYRIENFIKYFEIDEAIIKPKILSKSIY